MKLLYGESVYKVNVDAGFTCPNRDGTAGYGGCIYCNNDSFRPGPCEPALGVDKQVENGISYLSKRYKARKFIAYFQPYTNTYAHVDELRRLYYQALSNPSVIGIAIGTRPDSVDEEKLQLLKDISRDYFVLIEYGLQSIYDKSLTFINRGHNYDCFLKTIELSAKMGLKNLGAHIIVGFPTESLSEMMDMAGVISTLPINFLKIHQLQVIKSTALAVAYEKSPFYVFSYEEYLEFIREFIQKLSPHLVIQRLFATAPDDILIAPLWNKTRQQIIRDIELMFTGRDIYQGKLFRFLD
ncbi:TIGR01212 family radical SAM protein [Candidatus Magnetomonas plexicatena]|uniref:TIGR01212 family radical SAM protein n=1 Tax=Candidatus Magnetomonas plexicatena TaxID=2552947 RepID=UPI001C749C08|nr:TIGR01212 family radical SAM protein [Nitrospirales bacterium LBB_01]